MGKDEGQRLLFGKQSGKNYQSIEDPETEAISIHDFTQLLFPYFWPSSWTLRGRVAGAISMMVASRGFRIVAPLYLKQATNELSVSGLTSMPTRAIIMFCVCLFGFAFSKQLQTYLYLSVKQQAYQSVAARLFSHLHSLSMNYHLTKKTGKVLRVLDRGSESTDNIVNVLFFRLVPTLFEVFVVSLVFVFAFHETTLSLVCCLGVVLYVITTAFGTHLRLQFKKKTNDHDNTAHEKALDSLTNFEVVKYFCTEDYESQRYMASISLFQQSALSARAILNLIVVSQQFIQQSCLAICLLVTARGIFVTHTMSLGDFVAVSVYIGNIFKPLDSLGAIYNTIVQSLVDMENLIELLKVHPEIVDKPFAPKLRVDPSNANVEFRDVSFRYPSQPLANGLKQVNLTIPSGTSLALVGSTGSGKTTISRLLFRFYEVSSGKILINGQDIAEVTQRSLRMHIGIVPQDTVMFNDSIRYNLMYGCINWSESRMLEAAKAARIDDLISSLPDGFDTQVGERGLKLSGGEKQRIAIARLILKNPAIVVLDEATSSLDTLTEQQVHEQLESVCKGRTTLIIAHRLSTIQQADSIMVLGNGRVLEQGSHQTLLACHGVYQQLWQQQQMQEQVMGDTSAQVAATPEEREAEE